MAKSWRVHGVGHLHVNACQISALRMVRLHQSNECNISFGRLFRVARTVPFAPNEAMKGVNTWLDIFDLVVKKSKHIKIQDGKQIKSMLRRLSILLHWQLSGTERWQRPSGALASEKNTQFEVSHRLIFLLFFAWFWQMASTFQRRMKCCHSCAAVFVSALVAHITMFIQCCSMWAAKRCTNQ